MAAGFIKNNHPLTPTFSRACVHPCKRVLNHSVFVCTSVFQHLDVISDVARHNPSKAPGSEKISASTDIVTLLY